MSIHFSSDDSFIALALQASMPVVDGRALDVWRTHRQFDASKGAVCPQACNEATLHDPELIRRLRGLIGACDPQDCAIIYVHRGYQPRYRTPLFQSLLAQLPRVGGQFSHRCADHDLPQEVFALILSSLTQFRDVILVWDKTDRLLAAGNTPSDTGPLAVIYGMRSDGAAGFTPHSHLTFYPSKTPTPSGLPPFTTATSKVPDHVTR